MRSHLFYIVGTLAIIGALGLGATGKYSYVASSFANLDSGSETMNDLSAVYRAFFKPSSIQVEGLKDKFDEVAVANGSSRKPANKTPKKIRILLMPGHEPGYGGAVYKDLKEREMAVALVNNMKNLFEQDGRFEVIVPRTNSAWAPEFDKYFNEHWAEIQDFQAGQKEEMIRLTNSGSLVKLDNGIYHNSAPTDVATRLFGINKWANENQVDIAIHAHFNDYPRDRENAPGDYEGFAIYVPEEQYSNSKTSKFIAENIHKRLAKFFSESNLPSESGGVVEEQQLIAIGSYNTVEAPSMLIEYGYIYEPQFKTAAVRKAAFQDLANATYLGVLDFFKSGEESVKSKKTKNNNGDDDSDEQSLVYEWKKSFNKDAVALDSSLSADSYALQKALTLEGVYPPAGKSRYDCPISGQFGPCTEKALSDFQKVNGIKGEVGRVGDKTRKILNTKFGLEII